MKIRRCIIFLMLFMLASPSISVFAIDDNSVEYGYAYEDGGNYRVVSGAVAQQIFEERSEQLSDTVSASVFNNFAVRPYDVLGLTARITYEDNPYLSTKFKVGEFILYQLLCEQYNKKLYFRTAAPMTIKSVINLVNTYFPHSFGWSYTYSKKDGYCQYEFICVLDGAFGNKNSPDKIAAEREYAAKFAAENITPSMSEYEKAKVIHDHIISITDYTKKCEHKGQLAYCALHENIAVCNGYANAFALLCSYAGINVTSYANNSHRWNVIYDKAGIKRLVDATWDDSKGSIIYDYFWKTYSGTSAYKRSWNAELGSFITYLNGSANDFEYASRYTVYGTDSTGATLTSFSIDMLSEIIELPNVYTSYVVSIDGGVKWKKLSSASVAKLLKSKEINLVIAETADKKTPVAGTEVYFGKFAPRPKVRLNASYKALGDDVFCLIDSSGAVVNSLVYTDSTSKELTAYDFDNFPDIGLNVPETKTRYKVALAPVISGTSITPKSASKSYSVVMKNAPAVKIDKKTETIKLKKGISYRVNGEPWSEPLMTSVKIDVSGYIASRAVLEFYIPGTSKAPSSKIYTISPDYSGDKKLGAVMPPKRVS